MQITHYLASLSSGLGGPIKVVKDICAKLALRGHQMTLLTHDAADVDPRWCRPDAHAHRLPHVEVLPSPLWHRIMKGDSKRACREILARHQLLNVHGSWYPANITICDIALALKVPYIYTMHGGIDDVTFAEKSWRKRIFFELFQRRQLKTAAAMHCMAQTELEQSSKWYPAGKGVVVPCLVDFDPFLTLPGPTLARETFPFLQRETPKVLCLSRLHPIKHIEVIVDAVALLRERNVPCDLIIAGGSHRDRKVTLINGLDPYEHFLRERVKEKQIDDRTIFTGAVSGPTKVSLYESCDLFAQASTHENFGLVFLEAMAAGTPVVTTQGAGLWREMQSSTTATIVAHDPSAFADAFQQRLANRAALAAQRPLARSWALTTFDNDKVVAMYEAMYQACVGACVGASVGDRVGDHQSTQPHAGR
jgi:glycosyltransferase involved in cell wall biosynthesis